MPNGRPDFLFVFFVSALESGHSTSPSSCKYVFACCTYRHPLRHGSIEKETCTSAHDHSIGEMDVWRMTAQWHSRTKASVVLLSCCCDLCQQCPPHPRPRGRSRPGRPLWNCRDQNIGVCGEGGGWAFAGRTPYSAARPNPTCRGRQSVANPTHVAPSSHCLRTDLGGPPLRDDWTALSSARRLLWNAMGVLGPWASGGSPGQNAFAGGVQVFRDVWFCLASHNRRDGVEWKVHARAKGVCGRHNCAWPWDVGRDWHVDMPEVGAQKELPMQPNPTHRAVL